MRISLPQIRECLPAITAVCNDEFLMEISHILRLFPQSSYLLLWLRSLLLVLMMHLFFLHFLFLSWFESTLSNFSEKVVQFLGGSTYVDVFLTAGVTKTGEIFHTSLAAEDVFAFKNVKLPEGLIKMNPKATYNGLSFNVQNIFYQNFCSATLPIVRRHHAGAKVNPAQAKYGELNFFSCEELNVPAPSLPALFSLNWGEAGRKNDITVKGPFQK